MSRKRKKSVPTVQPKQEKKLVIDMMKVERAKANHNVGFRTGKHLTEKDRPRKKDWKREYERGKGSGASYKERTDPFRFEVYLKLRKWGIAELRFRWKNLLFDFSSAYTVHFSTVPGHAR